MRKINTAELEEYSWSSPKGKFRGVAKNLSEALGWDAAAASARDRHPFAVEILRIAPGETPYPYHSHSAQWEFYHVLSGHGLARDEGGEIPIGPGDAFLFGPGEAHQLSNKSTADLVICVVADNPAGESSYYPDSQKWIVRSPERRVLRSEGLDYYDGEE